MTLFAFIGVAVTSASVIIFGEPIWDPVVLLGKFNSPVVAFIAVVALTVATLTTNVSANVVSPSNDFSNLNPRRISFRTGGLITGFIGVFMMPWKLLADFSTYIFGWLVGYSGLLGPIAGIMIVDYFLIRKRDLDVDALYRRGGIYEYSGGVNFRAVTALLAGIAVALLGLVAPPVRWLYDYAWFIGFLVSGVVYLSLMKKESPQ
jgi:NCS1 family nucleobase:cation symporter-1